MYKSCVSCEHDDFKTRTKSTTSRPGRLFHVGIHKIMYTSLTSYLNETI